MRLGEALRALRRRAALTQQDLADQAGLSVGTLRDLEQGRVRAPRPATLRRLAAALELSDVETAGLVRLGRSADPQPHGLRLRVLGPLAIVVDGVPVDPGSTKHRSLLATLALNANAPVPLDTLVEVMWGGSSPDRAGLVQNHVSRLRQRLRPGRRAGSTGQVLVATGGGYQLCVSDDELDLLDFRRLVARARETHRDGDLASSYDGYRQAIALWSGRPLTDLAGLGVVPQMTALERELRAVTVEYADIAITLGRYEEVLAPLQRITDADPLHEAAHVRLVLALAGSGQQAAALWTYETLRCRLADELGVDPGPELMDAYRRVLRQEISPPARTGEALPAGRALQQVHQRVLIADPALDEARVEGVPIPQIRVIPRQLPASISGFIGRKAELKQLDGLLSDQVGEPAGAMMISAITGMAGVGKTALALRWAHLVADRFPDGQLYVNLRGFDPVGRPVDPGRAVRGFLTALGIAPQQIPAELPEQMALYRGMLADRRLLIVLDNARDAEQVRPMLPGEPGCLVIVTSRDQLAGLVAIEGARLVQLDLFSLHDAHDFLAARLGADRVSAQPAAAKEVIGKCGRLPLALAVVAARAATRPHFPLSTMVLELSAAPDVLTTFENNGTDLRGAFSWSYRTLGTSAARLFRLLGLHPGPDIGVAAAASLIGAPVKQARSALAELARAHLVTESIPGRFILHDLLHSYATELATELDAEQERRQALSRVLDHYLHTALAACRLLDPHRAVLALKPPGAGVRCETLADRIEAQRWFTAEQPVLLAAIAAAGDGFEAHAWQLAWFLVDHFDYSGRYHDLAVVQETALEAARRLGDRRAQAYALRALGGAYAQLGPLTKAQTHYRLALGLFAELDNPEGQASVHLGLARVLARQARYADALDHATQALDLHKAARNRAGEARAHNAVGWYEAQAGNFHEALIHCQRALVLQRAIGDQRGEANTLHSLGYAHQRLGKHDRAIVRFRQAHDLFAGLGDRYDVADTLSYLGDAYLAIGQEQVAQHTWQQALEIFVDMGHSGAERVGVRLRSLQDSLVAPGQASPSLRSG